MAGPLAAVERFFERLFERPAARLFQPQVEVVQIQRALERVMESERRVQSRRSYVPTTFRVLLNDADAAAMGTDMRALTTELAESLRLYARSRGYTMLAQPRIEIGTSSTVPQSDVRAYAEPLVLPASAGNGNGNGHGNRQGALVRPPNIPARSPAPPDIGEPTATYAAPQTATPRAQLAVRAPGHQVLRVPVKPGTLHMGRSLDNDIVLSDDKVSRHHGQIGVRLGMLVYTDLGSTNGSFLNGSAVTEIALGPGRCTPAGLIHGDNRASLLTFTSADGRIHSEPLGAATGFPVSCLCLFLLCGARAVARSARRSRGRRPAFGAPRRDGQPSKEGPSRVHPSRSTLSIRSAVT